MLLTLQTGDKSEGRLASGSTGRRRKTQLPSLSYRPSPPPLPISGDAKLLLKHRYLKSREACRWSQSSHCCRKRTSMLSPMKEQRHFFPYQFTIIAALFSAMNGSSPLAFIVAKKKIQRMYWDISYKLVLLLGARKTPSPGSEHSSVSGPGHFQFAALPAKAPCTPQPKGTGDSSDKSQSFCPVTTSLLYPKI